MVFKIENWLRFDSSIGEQDYESGWFCDWVQDLIWKLFDLKRFYLFFMIFDYFLHKIMILMKKIMFLKMH